VKITLIALSHKIEPWAQQAVDQFVKRFPPDWKLEIKELKPEDRSKGRPVEKILENEADRLIKAIPKGAKRVAFDERGKTFSSAKLADTLEQWHQQGEHLCLVIGSADGLCPSFKAQCDEIWRLSDLTLPHALARVLACEALYRAWSITAGHPYHRE
jgi:23S rRNA (pseudouridine1915-N3)-methyltransferase